MTLCVASVAALKLPLPAWLAVIVAVPRPTTVSVFPETETTDGFELIKVSAKPEDAVANVFRLIGLDAWFKEGKALNVII